MNGLAPCLVCGLEIEFKKSRVISELPGPLLSPPKKSADKLEFQRQLGPVWRHFTFFPANFSVGWKIIKYFLINSLFKIIWRPRVLAIALFWKSSSYSVARVMYKCLPVARRRCALPQLFTSHQHPACWQCSFDLFAAAAAKAEHWTRSATQRLDRVGLQAAQSRVSTCLHGTNVHACYRGTHGLT